MKEFEGLGVEGIQGLGFGSWELVFRAEGLEPRVWAWAIGLGVES